MKFKELPKYIQLDMLYQYQDAVPTKQRSDTSRKAFIESAIAGKNPKYRHYHDKIWECPKPTCFCKEIRTGLLLEELIYRNKPLSTEVTDMAPKKTQSQRIVELMALKKIVTRAQIAKKLGVKQDMVASYIAELVRVYGAKIEHEKGTDTYRLKEAVTVSPQTRIHKSA